ncbi:MAG: hypothetical protein ACUBOA_03335 [Candidatus Loosdrechtia sp.]|uniref:hypothetical protein n=1 Tax=Candidatus Loosdrechtia sp. TaxID=3101272 RepID=UPI00403B322D
MHLALHFHLGFLIKVLAEVILYSPFSRYLHLITKPVAERDIPLATTIAQRGIKRQVREKLSDVVNTSTVKNFKVLPELNYVKKEKFRVLDKVLSVLEGNGIRPFLSFGLLLGMVREADIMNHDKDLDIGVFTSEALSGDVRGILLSAGFEVKHFEGGEWPCRIKVFDPLFPVSIDIVFFHRENDTLLTYVKYAGYTIIRKRKPFGLRQDTFLGRHVWVPSHPEEFLIENYGQWKVKPDYYHYILSSPLTDFSQPVIHYCLLQELFLSLAVKRFHHVRSLLKIARTHFKEDTFFKNICLYERS